MPNLNKVMLMGNLTRDIEVRHTPNTNTAIAQIGLAVNRKWRTPEGETKEEVTFVDCEAWGRTAEVLAQYLKKGRPVYLEGRLRLDQWQDKESGQNRSKLKVVVETFQFIDSKPGEGGPAGGGGGNVQTRSYGGNRAPAQSGPAGAPGPAHEPIGEEDIPF
ncbi:MAG: single-stranded DNA-binding protein [Phycisphaerales bacterium]